MERPWWLEVVNIIYIASLIGISGGQFYWARRYWNHANRRKRSKFTAWVFLISGLFFAALFIPMLKYNIWELFKFLTRPFWSPVGF